MSFCFLISEAGAIAVPPWLVPYLCPEASETRLTSMPCNGLAVSLFLGKSAKMPVPPPPPLSPYLLKSIYLSGGTTLPRGGEQPVFSLSLGLLSKRLVEPVKPGMCL